MTSWFSFFCTWRQDLLDEVGGVLSSTKGGAIVLCEPGKRMPGQEFTFA